MSNRAMMRGVVNTPMGDPHWANVVSLLHFNGADGSTSFVDEKGLSWTAGGDVYISTTNSRFGGSAMYVDGVGNNDLIYTNIGKLALDDFTIEGWFLFSSIAWVSPFGGHWGLNSFIFRLSSEMVGWQSDVDNPGGSKSFYVSASFSPNVWYHLALVRSSGVFAIYQNGVQLGTSSIVIDIQTDAMGLGRSPYNPVENMQGYIDEFRITKGVARYTANFTPPTSEFLNF